MKVLVGCALVLVVLVIAFGFSALLGWIAAWILGQFGFHVGWFVCAVAIWLVSVIGRGIFGPTPAFRK